MRCSLAGVLGAGTVAVHPADIADPSSVPVHLALFTAVVVAALGLPGLYAVQAERSGALGVVGLVALFVGLLFADPIHSILAFTAVPVLAIDPSTRELIDGPSPGLMGPLMIAVPVLLLGLLITAHRFPSGAGAAELAVVSGDRGGCARGGRVRACRT